MRRTLVLCLALSLPVTSLASQPPPASPERDAAALKSGTALIRGRVTDKESGVPLEAFTVTLAMQTGDRAPAQNTRTNADGRFEFTRLAAGRYIVVAAPGPFRASHVPQGFGDTGSGGAMSRPKPFDVRDGEVRETEGEGGRPASNRIRSR